jgi:hypothetical protein
MDFLVNHAIKNIWCSPGQDGQYLFKLKRLTPTNGMLGAWSSALTSVGAPSRDARYHLFDLGSVYPGALNLTQQQGVWLKVSDCTNTTKTLVELYFGCGVMIPASTCYFMYTYDRSLFVAVKEVTAVGKLPGYDALCDYTQDDVYMRVYKNAYYETPRWASAQTAIGLNIPQPVFVQGQLVTSTAQILAFQNLVTTLRVRAVGTTLTYKNGFRIDAVDLTNTAVGDYIELVYDGSIMRTDSFGALPSIPVFTSTLDAQKKYHLHLTGAIGTILYNDDIDLYLYDPVSKLSLFIHKNATATMRNLTNRDYSLRFDTVAGLLASSKGAWSGTGLQIVSCIRKSGYERTLVDEHHRIKELYKLSDAQVKQAMIGVNSTVPQWTAVNLEAGEYPALMSAKYKDITLPVVTKALGYNAIAKLMGTAMQKLSGNINVTRTIDVPLVYQLESGAFFYDAQGFLYQHDLHMNLPTHTALGGAAYVEWVRGLRSTSFDEYLDQTDVALDPVYDYRFYVRPKVSDPHLNAWVDVSGDTSKVTITDGVASWVNGVQDTLNTLIRSNKGYVWNAYSTTLSDGLFSFNLTSTLLVNDINVTRVLEVPPGEIDVFLNGRSLIYGLDYFINFPAVTITNKEYLLASGVQVVNVRMKGLCNADMSFTDTAEYGFMVAGRLSVDKVVDIRDDKPQRVQINGRVVVPGEVVFNEDTNTYSTVQAWEGKPYTVKDVVTPLKDYTGVDTLVLRGQALQVDQTISNYLTRFRTPPPTPPVTVISTRYKVYSPLLAKLTMDLSRGDFTPEILMTQYNDQQLQEAIANYMYLYTVDPIHPLNRPPANYVIIHPTHLQTLLSLNIWKYTFLERVVRLLAPGLVTLTGSLVISPS